MKVLLVLTYSFLSLFAGNQQAVRTSYHQSFDSEKGLEKLIANYKSSDDAVISAYVGLCESTMAQFASFPNTKLSYFNKGKKRIENAIKKDKASVELRYVRLMLQLNAPEFLGYSSHRSTDINYFNKNLSKSNLSSYWKKAFIANLLKTKYISVSQKATLIKLKNTLK